eukprot:1666779-Prymnesium_polylepis.1
MRFKGASGTLSGVTLPNGFTLSAAADHTEIVDADWQSSQTWIADGAGAGKAELWLTDAGSLTYRVVVEVEVDTPFVLVCPPGEIAILHEAAVPFCRACSPGTYQTYVGGQRLCADAEPGFYANAAGTTNETLLTCPPNSQNQITLFRPTTNTPYMAASKGANSLLSCTCVEGYFNMSSVCTPCPDGAVCLGGLFMPFAQPGYGQFSLYSASATPGEVPHFYECPGYETCKDDPNSQNCDCKGGSYTRVEMNGISLYDYTPYQCNEGYVHGSELCSRCTDDDSPAGAYTYINRRCRKCPGIGNGALVFFTILTVLVWFPLLRQLIAFWAKSMYTTTSFLQYL